MGNQFFNRFFWGMGLIVAGVLFLLHQTGQITLNIYYLVSTYWPLIIIYYCLKELLFQRKTVYGWSGTMLWSLFGLCIGLFFLGRNLNIFDFSIGQIIPYVIPIMLILFGLKMVLKPSREPLKKRMDYEPQPPKTFGKFSDTYERAMNKSSFIGDVYLGQDFWELQPMNISHFIGDTVLDITKAQIPYGETKITISAFIGDVKVFIPNDIELKVSVIYSSFLGDSHVFERQEGGLFSSMKIEPNDYQIADKRIRLVMNMFIGDLKVQRIG